VWVENENMMLSPRQKQSSSADQVELTTKIAELETQLQAAVEQNRRGQADYQNLLRRQQEQASRLSRLASRELVEALLQPLYHLELAAAQLQDPGLNMVVTQFWQQLNNQGLEKVGRVGDTFDPQLMEVVESHGSSQTVSKIMQPGYRLHGELVQPAKVVVGTAVSN
jgi:molecular chaperone GrpE